MKNNGFTVIEMLVVILVVGILSSIVFVTIGNQIKQSQLRVAASKVSEMIEQARNDSIKTSKDQAITWTAGRFQVGNHVAALENVSITNPVSDNLSYKAPYGDFRKGNDLAGGYRLDLQDSTGTLHTAVDLVGVTGKTRIMSIEKVGVEVQ